MTDKEVGDGVSCQTRMEDPLALDPLSVQHASFALNLLIDILRILCQKHICTIYSAYRSISESVSEVFRKVFREVFRLVTDLGRYIGSLFDKYYDYNFSKDFDRYVVMHSGMHFDLHFGRPAFCHFLVKLETHVLRLELKLAYTRCSKPKPPLAQPKPAIAQTCMIAFLNAHFIWDLWGSG